MPPPSDSLGTPDRAFNFSLDITPASCSDPVLARCRLLLISACKAGWLVAITATNRSARIGRSSVCCPLWYVAVYTGLKVHQLLTSSHGGWHTCASSYRYWAVRPQAQRPTDIVVSTHSPVRLFGKYTYSGACSRVYFLLRHLWRQLLRPYIVLERPAGRLGCSLANLNSVRSEFTWHY